MTSLRYLQISFEAQQNADGPSLTRLLKRIIEVFPADWAAITDFDCSGQARPHLLTNSHEMRVVKMLDLLNLLEQTEQIQWASIFLCTSREQADTISASEQYPSALSKAVALVRVVDIGWYYVYGPLDKMDGIRAEFADEEKAGLAEELDFPE